MPDCYTHVYVATQALMRSGLTVASTPAYMAGANGPDLFFMYQAHKKMPKPNLRALAAKMHREKTGDFARALISNAVTPVQQSYTLGFITHYTTDCTLNPYIAAMAGEGMPYNEKLGRCKMENALDSKIYFDLYKTRCVALHAGTPVLITQDLSQVCTLLRDAIKEVYEVELPLVVLADAFHENVKMRKKLYSSTGFKRFFRRLFETERPEKYGAPLSCRMQPAPKLRRLPEKWVNPYTSEEMDLNLDEVLSLAVQTGAVCITAAMHYWLGRLTDEKLISVLGNNNYCTGLPCKNAEEPAANKPAVPGALPKDSTAAVAGEA